MDATSEDPESPQIHVRKCELTQWYHNLDRLRSRLLPLLPLSNSSRFKHSESHTRDLKFASLSLSLSRFEALGIARSRTRYFTSSTFRNLSFPALSYKREWLQVGFPLSLAGRTVLPWREVHVSLGDER